MFKKKKTQEDNQDFYEDIHDLLDAKMVHQKGVMEAVKGMTYLVRVLRDRADELERNVKTILDSIN